MLLCINALAKLNYFNETPKELAEFFELYWIFHLIVIAFLAYNIYLCNVILNIYKLKI